MSDELVYLNDDTLTENLEALTREESLINAQRDLELYDIAASMARFTAELLDTGLSCTDILAVISDALNTGSYSGDPHIPAFLLSDSRSRLSILKTVDMASLSLQYIAVLKEMGINIAEGDFLDARELPETFTYVRNSLSDEAYDVFSEDFRDPRVFYSSTFKECAAALSDGRVSYCLLPLEERGGVRLPSVFEMIFRNDFKINSVTPVFGPTASADMKYALVSKSFIIHKRETDDDRYLEIRIYKQDGNELAGLLSAVSYLGMSIFRIDTFTASVEGEESTFFSVVIKDRGVDFSALFVYLALTSADFTPVGMYKNLE